jgi:superfamily II DNA or RNA helicase
MSDYQLFLQEKAITDIPTGHEPGPISPMLFDFQQDLTRWALRRGRAALFCDCGMGKSFMQLEWAHHVTQHTGGKVLILAPLAVSRQTKQEGIKLGVTVNICRGQEDLKDGINITNYEMLHKFNPADFAGVVLDESGILKAYTGKYRTQIIEAFGRTPYRLACTATPAPNDFMELGNHAEFLGVMGRSEMLSMFFVNDAGDTGTWRLKGHAEGEFWKWVCSWAVMIRKPSDLGYEDGGFTLPALHIQDHVIKTTRPLSGFLFHEAAKTLSDRRQARRESLDLRCTQAAALANQGGRWLVWCDLNDESEMLTRMIDGAVEVKGADTNEHKEQALNDFAAGKIRVLVSKPRIAGWGMNFQCCHNMAFVGLSDSYEAYYQAVRRCWRFGQKEEVHAHIITSELEGNVSANIKRKEQDATKMAIEMVKNMADISSVDVRGSVQDKSEYHGKVKMELPEFMINSCE